jgi:peptidyl-prolyl cis-trans isomerase D
MRDLKRFRWPATILLGLVIISFVAFYGWQPESFERERRVEFAKVRSESWNPLDEWTVIGPDLMQRAERRVRARKSQLLPPQVAQVMNEARMRDLTTLDETRREAANILLIERAADRMGIEFTQAETIQMMQEQQPGLTNQLLDQIARQSGFQSQLDFVRAQRQAVVADHTLGLVRQLAHASLFELWQEYSLTNETIGLSLAAYPAANFEDRVTVTEDDLATYLADHRERFKVPARRQYAYVKLTKDQLKGELTPTAEQLQVYYEQHQADYREVAAIRADELLVSLTGHETDTTFTQRALDVLSGARARAAQVDNWTTLSRQLRDENPGVQVLSFSTSWLTSDSRQRSPEYLKTLRTLSDDAVSTPIVDSTRAVTMRIRERRPDGVPPLEKIRARVESDYLAMRADEVFAERAAQWRRTTDEIVEQNGGIAEFAAAVAAQDELSTPVAVDAVSIPGVGNLAVARDYLPRLRTKELSDLIQTADSLVVLQIVSVTDAYEPPLAEVREDVESALRAERSGEFAKLEAEQNLAAVRGGAEFETVMADAPLKIADAPPIRRTDPVAGLGSPLIDFREEAASLRIGGAGISPYGYNADNPTGYAIWKVISLEEPSREQFARERYQFQRDYVQLQQFTVVEEWLADQRAQADYTPIDPETPAGS